MYTYTYTPPQDKRTSGAVSITLLIVGFIALAVGELHGPRMICQLICAVMLVGGIYIMSKYALTSYRYILSPLDDLHNTNDLVVEQIQGSRRKVVCSLELSNTVAFVPKTASISELSKTHGHISRSFSYCPSLLSDERYVYIFEFNGEQHAVILQCGEDFVREFRARIEVSDVGESDN